MGPKVVRHIFKDKFRNTCQNTIFKPKENSNKKTI